MRDFDQLGDDPPEELSESARVFWLRLAPVLWRRGLLREAGEIVQFEQLCFELGTVADCEERLRVDGLTVLDRRNREAPHSALAAKAAYEAHARESFGLLGLDPGDPELVALHGLGAGKPS